MSTDNTRIRMDYDEYSCLLHDQQHKQTKWQKLLQSPIISLLPSIFLTIILWFGISPSDDLSETAIHLLAIFIG